MPPANRTIAKAFAGAMATGVTYALRRRFPGWLDGALPSRSLGRTSIRCLPGSFGPATGNAITGAGTITGSSGADSRRRGARPRSSRSMAPAAQAVASDGATSRPPASMASCRWMRRAISITCAIPARPTASSDVFNYTLADAPGANAPRRTLTIDIGQVAAAAAGQGIVNLPAGVELSDIHVVGRDLVIDMPDGTQMVIPNGAVFVPQLAIGDVAGAGDQPCRAADRFRAAAGRRPDRRAAAAISPTRFRRSIRAFRSATSFRRPSSATRRPSSSPNGQFIDTQADGRSSSRRTTRRARSTRSIRSTRRACPAPQRQRARGFGRNRRRQRLQQQRLQRDEHRHDRLHRPGRPRQRHDQRRRGHRGSGQQIAGDNSGSADHHRHQPRDRQDHLQLHARRQHQRRHHARSISPSSSPTATATRQRRR